MKAKTRHLLILPALLFGLVTWAQVAKTPKRGLENPQETVTLASISLNTDSEDTLVPSVQQTVAATTGHINLDIVRKDGKPFALSHPNGKPTVDDGQLRKLVAFLELMAYDLFAE